MTAETAVVVTRLDRIGDALERIAGVLERTTAPESEPGSANCLHPEDARVQFGGMGESDGFQCKACGEFIAPVKLGA